MRRDRRGSLENRVTQVYAQISKVKQHTKERGEGGRGVGRKRRRGVRIQNWRQRAPVYQIPAEARLRVVPLEHGIK